MLWLQQALPTALWDGHLESPLLGHGVMRAGVCCAI